jgi:AraC family transcriptional regulator
LSDELAIATLAAQIPMSQFHFARAFKAAMGEPPHRYIMQRQIERAKVLLSATRLSTAEVAYQVGFSNQSHFTMQFRKLVGMTPGSFESLHNHQDVSNLIDQFCCLSESVSLNTFANPWSL